MAIAGACPDAEVLRGSGAGLLPPPAVEALVGHLEKCPQCLARVQAIPVADALVVALSRASPQPEGPDSEVVGCLIARLKTLSAAPTTSGSRAYSCSRCALALQAAAAPDGKAVRCPVCGDATQVPGAAD